MEVADLDIEVGGTGSGRRGGTGTSGGGSGGGGTRGYGGGPGTSQQHTSPRANQMKKAASNVATAGNGSHSNGLGIRPHGQWTMYMWATVPR